jgi:hypothetical protein
LAAGAGAVFLAGADVLAFVVVLAPAAGFDSVDLLQPLKVKAARTSTADTVSTIFLMTISLPNAVLL